ncbi:hypothetical protein AZ09_09455 [Acetobacter aceti 1023]|nr:hypothetical protein AZ09_09455 [Acetobacter aceti 1023]
MGNKVFLAFQVFLLTSMIKRFYRIVSCWQGVFLYFDTMKIQNSTYIWKLAHKFTAKRMDK